MQQCRFYDPKLQKNKKGAYYTRKQSSSVGRNVKRCLTCRITVHLFYLNIYFIFPWVQAFSLLAFVFKHLLAFSWSNECKIPVLDFAQRRKKIIEMMWVCDSVYLGKWAGQLALLNDASFFSFIHSNNAKLCLTSMRFIMPSWILSSKPPLFSWIPFCLLSPLLFQKGKNKNKKAQNFSP